MSPIISNPEENLKKNFKALMQGDYKEALKQFMAWEVKLEVIAYSIAIIVLASMIIWQFFYR